MLYSDVISSVDIFLQGSSRFCVWHLFHIDTRDIWCMIWLLILLTSSAVLCLKILSLERIKYQRLNSLVPCTAKWFCCRIESPREALFIAMTISSSQISSKHCPGLYTLDISRYNITGNCTQHNNFDSKSLVTLRAHGKHP